MNHARLFWLDASVPSFATIDERDDACRQEEDPERNRPDTAGKAKLSRGARQSGVGLKARCAKYCRPFLPEETA